MTLKKPGGNGAVEWVYDKDLGVDFPWAPLKGETPPDPLREGECGGV